MKKLINQKILYSLFSLSFVLQSCGIGPLADIEFTEIRWTYVTKENGQVDANYGRINNLFSLQPEGTLYQDTTYYLAINITLIASTVSENTSPRFISLIRFENFEVTNPIMEVLSGGLYRRLDTIETNDKGEKSKEAEAIFSIPPGDNTELDYYIVFQIKATPDDPNQFPIKSDIIITFKEHPPENIFENTSLNFFGRFRDGVPFSININYR
jgi:hypothetical protein